MSAEIALTDFSGMSHILRKSFLGHGGWLGSLIIAVTHATGVWEILLLPTIFILSWIVIRTSLPEISFLVGLSFDLAIPLQYNSDEVRARYAPRLESYWRKFTIGTLVELAAYFFLFDDLITLVIAFKTTIGLSLWIVDPTPLVAVAVNQPATSDGQASKPHFGKDAYKRGSPEYFDRKLYEGGYTDDAARDVLRKELMNEGKGLPWNDQLGEQMKKLEAWTGDTEENKKKRTEQRAAKAKPTRPADPGQTSIQPNESTAWPSLTPGTREYFDQKLRRGYFNEETEIKKALDKLMAIGNGKPPGDPEVLRQQEEKLEALLKAAEIKLHKTNDKGYGAWEYQHPVIGHERKVDEYLKEHGYDDEFVRQLLILELREDPNFQHAARLLETWTEGSTPEQKKARMARRREEAAAKRTREGQVPSGSSSTNEPRAQTGGTERTASGSANSRQSAPSQQQNRPAPPQEQNRPAPPQEQNRPAPPQQQNRPAPPQQQNRPAPPQQQNRPANNNPAPSNTPPSNMILFGERSDILPEHHYLSNWYLSDFTDRLFPNITFKSVDHYVAYRKVCMFNDGSNADTRILPQILQASTAEDARRLGQRIRGFVPGQSDTVWNARRSEIMERGMTAKFAMNGMRRRLATTRGNILAAVLKKHGGGYDSELGIGAPGVFGGQNQMGVQLMRVRDRPQNAQWPGEIVFFHKEYPDTAHGYPDDGRHCFSNWYKGIPFSDPEIDANVNLKQKLGINTNSSIVFGTSEHYMMFWKALIHRNPRAAAEIVSPANLNRPNVAKDLATAAAANAPQTYKDLWYQLSQDIVRRGCFLKFTGPNAAEELGWLLDTEDAELVESADNDHTWGIKHNILNALANQARWGWNKLGITLKDVRTRVVTGTGLPPITWWNQI